MANDRIWIVCTTCGERTLLTKHLPSCDLGSGGFWQPPEKLYEWLTEHLDHHPNQYCMDLGGNPGLVFVTDDGPFPQKES